MLLNFDVAEFHADNPLLNTEFWNIYDISVTLLTDHVDKGWLNIEPSNIWDILILFPITEFSVVQLISELKAVEE